MAASLPEATPPDGIEVSGRLTSFALAAIDEWFFDRLGTACYGPHKADDGGPPRPP